MHKIVKYFNFLIKKTILKGSKKTNVNFKISNFNKYYIFLIASLFFYLFYLSVPTLYDKNWVQKKIKNKLFADFNIDFSTTSDISYNILPSPHFLIKNSKIFLENTGKPIKLSEIKELKVFVSQNNFFKRERLNIIKVIIDQANFTLGMNDLKFLNKANNNQLSEKKIIIENSNIFIKDQLNEVIAIVKISEALLFFDSLKLLNSFQLKASTFNIPFVVDLKNQAFSYGNKVINIKAQTLKLNILDESKKKDINHTIGANVISILNSKIYTKYDIKKNLINFKSNNFIKKNNNINYKGKLSLQPFDLDLDVNLKKYNLTKLMNDNSIINELIKTKLLFNDNITANFSLGISSNKNNEIFKSSIINFNLVNGKINLNKTRLINNKIGFLEIKNSDLIIEDSKLILKTDIVVEIHNSNNLFSLFQTPKKLRKVVKKILINIDYDFSKDQMNLNTIKIDNFKNNDEIKDVINEFNASNDYNLNKSRRIFNKLLSAYIG